MLTWLSVALWHLILGGSALACGGEDLLIQLLPLLQAPQVPLKTFRTGFQGSKLFTKDPNAEGFPDNSPPS